MLTVLAILFSAFLYRIPRGDANRWWADPLGLPQWGQTISALAWAILSGIALVAATGTPWWAFFLVAGALWAGEAPGYRWPTGNGFTYWADTNPWDGIWRGALLLNPMLGWCYKLALDFDAKAYLSKPQWQRSLWYDWTSKAELMAGLVTATSYAVLLLVIR